MSAAFPPSETFWGKMKRKTMENPLVPMGLVATSAFLFLGLSSFRKGDAARSQMMMRARVAAQGFTVVAFVVGSGIQFYQSTKAKAKVPGMDASVAEIVPGIEWGGEKPDDK